MWLPGQLKAALLWQFKQMTLKSRWLQGDIPLFAKGKIAGAIGVGGGTEEQDCAVAEYVLSIFEKETK